MIKNVKLAELNINIATTKYTSFKDHLIEHKCLHCNKNCQQKFDENLKERFLIHTKCLTTTIIILFYRCKKVFIAMNI